MCGIAGIFHCGSIKPVDPSRVERMCNAQVHRGPDGSGVWTDPGVGLGHRRLSIIDLAGSPQPMHSQSGRSVITFNGEIYNYAELRRELAGAGHRFATDGDTEVILAAWEEWGPAALDRLNGMFAFALYERETKTLTLVRDRFGVKPLHYAQLADGSVIFASELKGLLAHPMLRRRADPLAIEDYLAFGYVPDHRCMIAGVHKLPAGHMLRLSHGREPGAPQQWWDIDFSRRHRGSLPDLEAELLHHLREAVASRMVSDVPLGAFLSGGVDSSSVVALMDELSAGKVTTCSIGFDVAAQDETAYAQKVAGLFGTDHHQRTVSADQFDTLSQIAAMFDEPFADASALPTWRVCQLARESVTVALSGDGADEAFAGYRRHLFHAGEDRVRSILPQSIRGSVFGTLGRIYPKADWAPRPLRAKTTLLSLAESGPAAYARALSYTTPEQRASLHGPELRERLGDYRANDALERLMHNAPARDGLDAAQYADLKMWLPGDILTKVDRASMAVSLEAREPLLDHRLVEFAAALPRKGRIRGTQGKALMKKAMERYLPADILYRQKQGFVVPIAQWFRGPLRDEVNALPTSARSVRAGWFERQSLADIVARHLEGKADNSRLIWQIIMLEHSMKNMELDALN